MSSGCTYDEKGVPTSCPPGDNGPAIEAAIWALTATAAVFVALRVYCKLLTHRRLQLDDWVLVAAWVCWNLGQRAVKSP